MKVVFSSLNERALQRDEVSTYLKTEGVVSWIQAGELLDSKYDACVDGRTTEPIVGNPGGDIARLVEAILAINEVTGHKFTPLDIEAIFRWYLKKFGCFYMHTDEHALESLRLQLNRDQQIGRQFTSVTDLHHFLLHMPADFHQTLHLTRYLLDPAYIGCGHLKLMSLHPNRYQASVKLLRSLMMSFYDALWNGAPELKELLRYPILEGEHRERAVLVVRVAESRITSESWIPMVRPCLGEVSMFVEHPQVREYLAMNIAQAIGEEWLEGRLDGEIQRRDLYQAMCSLQGEGLRETVSALALGLPMYTVTISRE